MKTNRHFSSKNLFLFHLLKTQHPHKSNQEKGYILVIALGIVVALSGLVALYAKTANKSEKETTTAAVSSNTGFYGAEAQLNLRANKLRELYEGYEKPQGTSPTKADACFDNNNSNDGTGDYTCEETTISSNDDAMSDILVTTYVVEKNGGVGTKGIVPVGDPFENLSMEEFGHSIYALSFKKDVNYKKGGKQATAILQMDIKSRVIPMFQFAAFFDHDLEIFSNPNGINLNGPLHTNSDLYLAGSYGSGSTKTRVNGQITLVGKLFNYRPDINARPANGQNQVMGADGTTWVNLLQAGTGSTNPTNAAMNPALLAASAIGNRIKFLTEAVELPAPDFLNDEGEYFEKADIRITYNPQTTTGINSNYLNTIPFKVMAIDRTDSSGNAKSTPDERDLDAEVLGSLRQPVMVGADLAKIPAGGFNICTPAPLPTGTTFLNWWNPLTTDQKNAFREVAQDYLQRQIQSQNAPVRFSLLSNTMSTIRTTDTLLSTFAQDTTSFSTDPRLTTGSLFTAAQITTATTRLLAMTPQQIAGLPEFTGTGNGTAVANTSRCFVSAPITDIGRDNQAHKSPFVFYNNREQKHLRLLQLNIQSMAIWNRDGVYIDTGDDLVPTRDLLYIRASGDSNAPVNSFQNLGLAAIDNSNGGIVLHATVDRNNTNASNAYGNDSRYGFAVVRGKQLFGLARSSNVNDPTGLTIATDQAIYAQGDYNIVNYQPAAFLGDTFHALSNACIVSTEVVINRTNSGNCNNLNGIEITIPDNSTTEMRAALLAGSIPHGPSGTGGALDNLPRFVEQWNSTTIFRYRGSFVSLNAPKRTSKPWQVQSPYYFPPFRDWDYDTNFNNVEDLPPLSPRFVALKQESFIRSFDQ